MLDYAPVTSKPVTQNIIQRRPLPLTFEKDSILPLTYERNEAKGSHEHRRRDRRQSSISEKRAHARSRSPHQDRSTERKEPKMFSTPESNEKKHSYRSQSVPGSSRGTVFTDFSEHFKGRSNQYLSDSDTESEDDLLDKEEGDSSEILELFEEAQKELGKDYLGKAKGIPGKSNAKGRKRKPDVPEEEYKGLIELKTNEPRDGPREVLEMTVLKKPKSKVILKSKNTGK